MKNKNSLIKRIISVVMAAVLLFGTAASAVAVEEYTSGDYTYTLDGSNAKIVSYPETAEGAVNIPSTLDGFPVSEIGAYSFYACTLITSVTIPEGVTEIGANAFGFCTSLESVTIPKSVTVIGNRAFDNCNNLTDVYYAGTEAEWNAISISDNNEPLLDATIHFNSDVPEEPFEPDVSSYTVTWVVDGAKTTHSYEAGEIITPPANPTKSGYTFKGWNPSVPATMPEKDMTFTAVFEKAVYTITWIVDGTKTTHKYEYGAKITSPADPTKDGYTFVGWDSPIPATMPAENLTFTAVFEKNPEKENIYNLGEETYSFDNYGDWHSPNGHCFGMSMTSSGYYTGDLDVTKIGINSSDKLYTVTDTVKVKEPICYYQDAQNYSLSATVAGGTWYKTYNYITERGDYNIEKDWNEVVNYVKNHAYDGKGSLQIGFRKDGEGGHAINFLRYEEVNGQPRIYAYDNNCPEQETYFYKNSNGKILQAPYSTFSGSIDCIALRSVSKYFELAENFDSTRFIYADSDSIKVKDAKIYVMEGYTDGVERVMFEVPENATEVTITPLVDNAEFTYLNEEYSFGTVSDETSGTFKLAPSVSSDNTTEQKPGLEINSVEKNTAISIKTPSTTTISYGDSIILHAEVENLPSGAKIVWEADNSNFTLNPSADGTACTISPSADGNSTITAKIVDSNGNELGSDTQSMTSKAGFFQKIIAFFKSLFGMTKVIPEIFKI